MSVCVACKKHLVLDIDFSDDDEDTSMGGSSSAQPTKQVPDDVHLSCGCHFHWDCLLESYTIDSCPACNTALIRPTPNGGQQILCTLSNEGGVQENLDILPLLMEEAYLKAYPEETKARAFLEFCRAGDLTAIVEMIQDSAESEGDDEEMDEGEGEGEGQHGSTVDWLRYQDPIGDMQSGLHAAVAAGSREVVWLLLLMASTLDLQAFPPQVFQEAEVLGIMRPTDSEMEGKVDIRTLRDASGRSAEDVARENGGLWAEWIGNGRLVL
ncbi:hypothetical protein EJ05DRAFT_474996 [Pseudovirgaria hyperparasitica]|uniref:Uncharacterized protein n=1 Tax=Pseudovirgaria hyperparasitica TaxID=470096 RepID=A0A6A6WAT2_9PEZI|nr:uncharacterized protein EJ05DRAFT_474996 [Pseudovirgaria hyperparasitica]KAF2759968.1 hypothetical protein EJ05DRAFT_474996 [Pseudovirgaria hyperparasitica]